MLCEMMVNDGWCNARIYTRFLRAGDRGRCTDATSIRLFEVLVTAAGCLPQSYLVGHPAAPFALPMAEEFLFEPKALEDEFLQLDLGGGASASSPMSWRGVPAVSCRWASA